MSRGRTDGVNDFGLDLIRFSRFHPDSASYLPSSWKRVSFMDDEMKKITEPAIPTEAAASYPAGGHATEVTTLATRLAQPPGRDVPTPPDLEDPRLYVNRELSWLQFNARVLEEAEDEENPLLERVKFLSIFSSNLDEFFMIRISGLREQLSGGVLEAPPDGMTTSEQLAAVRQETLRQLTRFSDCYRNDVLEKLKAQGIHVLRYKEWQSKQRQLLRGYFSKEIFPALTPLAFDPSHPFPHISNLSLNLAVV